MSSRPAFPTVFVPLRPRAVLRGLERALDLVVPPSCLHCGALVRPGPWWPHLCAACARGLLPARDPLDASGIEIRAVFLHEGPARALLHALKYGGQTRVGMRLGRELARCAAARLDGVPPGGLATGVPLHRARRWRRGHDQVRALVRGLARELPWVRTATLLRRRRATATQVGLGPSARRRNVGGAFVLRSARSSERVRGRTIILLDDVVTTGATLHEAALPLLGAGAARVIALAAAVSLPGGLGAGPGAILSPCPTTRS